MLVPAVVPRVQLPTVAKPAALVVAVAPVTLPPPLATANVTVAPDTAAPNPSVTTTAGGTATAVPTSADCPSLPATFTMFAGTPACGATTVTRVES